MLNLLFCNLAGQLCGVAGCNDVIFCPMQAAL